MNIYDALVAGILGTPTKDSVDSYFEFGMLTQEQHDSLINQLQSEDNQSNVTGNQ